MSDHFSGPAVIGDPAVDITDFYAFPSPERAGNLVLIMDVFPMATPQSLFSDAVLHRFRLRPLKLSAGAVTHRAVESVIDVSFQALGEGKSVQTGDVVTPDGRRVTFEVGRASERDGVRVFAGLIGDPFFMDVEAALATDASGKLSFKREGTNTVQSRDVLSIVVELPFAPIVERFRGVTLVGAVAEMIVPVAAKPIRIERLGRPEIKNFVLASTLHDPRTKGVELRDLYNREDAFALSEAYRPLYESRLDANLAFYGSLDGETAWPLGPGGRHPLRDLLINDYLILNLAKAFAPGGFLEIERALLEGRPHTSSGGRWLEDDILDDMLTLFVNGGRGERLGDGVDGPTNPPTRTFPYVTKPNLRADLPLPAFLAG
ncbi:MAG: DUF4331 family protein [Hyphomicrobiales bacterium]|nr:DUF4331 family protein [Hyphomicrobiales bacterium]MBV8440161.1 DUF4331 family protein [Hyphomicrobiales bacterium]